MKTYRLVSIVFVALALGACATLPEDAFRLSESALELRELQTREYEGTSDIQILSASSGVLQDLGYAIDEIEKELGVLSASKRASAQDPTEIAGITLRDLFEELADQRDDGDALRSRVDEVAALLGTGPFLDRPVNEGLSGGEKKRSEIFQLAVLAPSVAVLDEIDSGLDVDAVREVAEAVERMRGPDIGVLLITHYNRILQYLTPDRIHVMVAGRIVQSGGPELADELEERGYTDLIAEFGGAEQPAEEDDFLAGL